MQQQGIEELQEFLEGVKEAAKAGKKIRDIVKDGVDASDLPKAFDLIKDQAEKIDVYVEAFSDFDKKLAQAKDIDSDEAVKLIMQLIAGIKEVEEV